MDIEEITAYLQTDEGKALIENHPATAGLRAAKDKVLGDFHATKDKLREFTELGDHDTLKAALDLYKAEQEKNKTKEDDKTAAELNHLKALLEAEKSARSQREGALIKSFVDKEISTTILENKGVPELLAHIVASRVKGTMQDDGSIVIEVLDADGQLMFKNGKPAKVSDLVAEIKANDKYSRAFDADVVTGSGTRTSTSTKPTDVIDMNDPNFNLDALMRKQSGKRK